MKSTKTQAMKLANKIFAITTTGELKQKLSDAGYKNEYLRFNTTSAWELALEWLQGCEVGLSMIA